MARRFGLQGHFAASRLFQTGRAAAFVSINPQISPEPVRVAPRRSLSDCPMPPATLLLERALRLRPTCRTRA